MCFGGGGGGGGYQQPAGVYTKSDGTEVRADLGLPQDAIDAGVTTQTGYQIWEQQQLSDKQIAAQKAIADQQMAFNQQQLDYQKQIAQQQQEQADAQAQRQTEYDTGRASVMQSGSDTVNQAFSKFNDDYFNNLAKSYMSKAQDQIDYQTGQEQKQMAFGLARAGILNSQAAANQQGLLSETAGRAAADQSAQAQAYADQQRQQVANAKSNLLGQVQASESLGSPIAANTEGGVQSALQAQRNVVSGISNQAGDVTSSFSAVPTVGTLSNIFANVINAGSSFLSGSQTGAFGLNFRSGLGGTNPKPT